MEDILINLGISAILTAVKNKQKRKQLRKAFLKVRNAINLAFAGDPEFFPEKE